jgi:hypothetical protein
MPGAPAWFRLFRVFANLVLGLRVKVAGGVTLMQLL